MVGGAPASSAAAYIPSPRRRATCQRFRIAARSSGLYLGPPPTAIGGHVEGAEEGFRVAIVARIEVLKTAKLLGIVEPDLAADPVAFQARLEVRPDKQIGIEFDLMRGPAFGAEQVAKNSLFPSD